MKIINNNVFKIMYDNEFIGVGEVKEITDKRVLNILLNQPNVVEYVDVKDVKDVKDENEKLKEQLALAKAKAKATELGIKFSSQIGLKSLLKKIEEAQ